MKLIIVTIVCLVIWYLYYGVECFMNGGSLGRNQFLMHFPLLWEEMMWIMPGGRQRRLDYCGGNAELAQTLPGIPHFVCTHLLLPFGMPLAMCFWR